MSKPADNVFRDMKRWVQSNGWWIHSIVVLFTLFIVLNTSEQRKWDSIGLTLTTLEIFLVMGAFAGFWLIRREAIAEAKETAEKVAQETVNARFQQEAGADKREELVVTEETPEAPSTEAKEAEENL